MRAHPYAIQVDDSERQAIVSVVMRAGFEIAHEYCSLSELVIPIRELEHFAQGGAITDLQRRALLENLRRLIMKTAMSGNAAASLAVQSRLSRWRHLRSASEEAADALVAVLGHFELDVPQYLRGEEWKSSS